MRCSFERGGRRGVLAAAVALLFVAGCALVTGSSRAADAFLSATVVADAPTVAPAGTDGYTVSISSSDGHPRTLASVFDQLPAGFSYVSGSTSGLTTADPTASAGRLEWAGPFVVPPMSTVSLRFQVRAADQPGRYLNVAGGVGPDGSFDSGPSAPIDVLAPAVPADLTVSIAVTPSSAHPGDAVTASIGVTNAGPGNATGIRLTAELPSNLTVSAVRTDTGTCSGTQTIACALGGLYSGRSATVTVDAVAGAVGAAQVTASVRGDDPDPSLAGNSASATVTVVEPPPPPPETGETVNVEPETGQVLVKVPSASSFVPLTELRQIPVGSEVDATAGTVDLTVASGAATYSALFYEGRFVVLQPSGVAAEVKLVGGDFSSCAKQARRVLGSEASPRTVRRLWGKGKGHFRTRGRYSSATVRGTTWLVADRCDGTLTQVVEGTVEVADLVAHKTVTVRAGKSYLAARTRTQRAGEPSLRSVSASGGHVVVAYALGDLIPGEVEVATRPTLLAGGGFPRATVKLRERLPQSTSGVVRDRTRGTVAPGVYYVVVSGFIQDATSCTPIRSHCLERWSNVLRVVVRAPA